MATVNPAGLYQLFILLLAFAWLALDLVALRRMGQRLLTQQARLIWVAVILLIPFLGALAFLIMRPGPPGDNLS